RAPRAGAAPVACGHLLGSDLRHDARERRDAVRGDIGLAVVSPYDAGNAPTGALGYRFLVDTFDAAAVQLPRPEMYHSRPCRRPAPRASGSTPPPTQASRLTRLACGAALACALLAGGAHAATVRVSVTDAEGQAYGSFAVISGDGRYVAFNSNSTAFTATTWNELYLRDVLNGTTTWVSQHPAHPTVNISGYGLAISQNGRIVAFGHAAPTLDSNTVADVFVKNLDTSALTRVSAAAPGQPESGDSLLPALSSDGRYVAFVSNSKLLAADTNATRDVYEYDMQTGTLYLVSVPYDGAQPNAACGSGGPSVSDDGCLVAFSCTASNLVPADGNGSDDVFVRNRCAGTI